jgi:hypothetical protein
MASSEARIALPTAVRRPVVRPSTTSSRTSRSVVGAWTVSAKPAKATVPIGVDEPRNLFRPREAARLGGDD